MSKSNKGFTLVELIVTIAVTAIVTTLATLFAISTVKSFRTEKKKSDAIYNVKDVHDFVSDWISLFDSSDYTLESVTESQITVKKTLNDDLYTLTYADKSIIAQTLTDEKIYPIPDVDTVSFHQKDNAIKVEVTFQDESTAFIVYRKTQ
ncbi:MAG: prepilin-type N-terminal cleavage/methylation domain-containing protein [Clostridia bacterium]|nr:prepilin-type N-terminal cleavage/methylation domain-containing protein [Clostridia bacterium]